MACINKTDLENAKLDALTLEGVITGPATGTGSTVTNRFGGTLNTLAKILSNLSGLLSNKGDLLTFGSALSVLPVGSNGNVLTADSSTPTGLKWAAGSGGGGVSVSFPPIVILATGQSNISQEETLTWSPPSNLKIWNWNGTTGTVGTAFTAVSGSVIGVSQSFAAEIAKANPNQNVYLIRIGTGAVAIAQWLTGATSPDMFANITANITPALTAAGATTIDTMLWWQGEKDAQNASTTYAADFETLIARFRTQSWFQYSTPITIFGINNETRGGTNYRTMNNTLARVAAVEPENRTFVYTASLPTSYWKTPIDSHMTAAGYTEAGKIAAHIYQGSTGRSVTSGLIYDPETGFFGMCGADPISGLTISQPSTALAALAAATSYPRLLMSSFAASALFSENKTTQSLNQGSFFNLYHNDGTSMLAGSRLGGFVFGGSSSATALRNAASLEAFADTNWVDGSSYGTYVVLKTTANGSTGRSEVIRFGANGNIGIAATIPLAKLSVGFGSLSDANIPVQISTGGTGTETAFGVNKNGSYGLMIGYKNASPAGSLGTFTGSYLRSVTSDPFAIVVNNVNASVLCDSVGSVGIGGVITNPTTFAGAKLIVNGSTGDTTLAGGLTLGGPIIAKSYTVGTLPSAGVAKSAYASNGRRSGEGAGLGKGIPVWSDSSNWRTYYDNSIVAA